MPRLTDCERLADPADPRIWTAHDHIDVTQITSGRQILLSGHKFWVADMTFMTSGRPTGDPRPGHDFMAGIGQVDLKLTHAQWKGCPAVDRSQWVPAGCAAALRDLHDAALRLLAQPELAAADAEFLHTQLAPLVDLDAPEGGETDG